VTEDSGETLAAWLLRAQVDPTTFFSRDHVQSSGGDAPTYYNMPLDVYSKHILDRIECDLSYAFGGAMVARRPDGPALEYIYYSRSIQDPSDEMGAGRCPRSSF